MKNKILNIMILLVFLVIELYNFKENYNNFSFNSLKSKFWLTHIGISTIYIIITTYILKIDIGYFDVFIFFLPLVGIGVLLCDILFSIFKGKIKNNIEEAYDIEKYITDDIEEKIELQNSLNTIAAYDALTVKNLEEKKKFIFEFNPPNIDFKVEILERALKDEDIDVIHYAAVELNRIDEELQNNIKEAERIGDKLRLYLAYNEYINSGILKNFMLIFYLEKSLNLLLELSQEKPELREDMLIIYGKLNKKLEYEELLESLIKESERKELIELMLEFLYKENRYEDMLKYYKRYSNIGIELPEIFQRGIEQ